MPRRKSAVPGGAPGAAPGPHQVCPTSIYTSLAVQAALRISKRSLLREVRAGRLRMAKRASKAYFLGAWLLEWVEKGEVRRGEGGEDRR